MSLYSISGTCGNCEGCEGCAGIGGRARRRARRQRRKERRTRLYCKGRRLKAIALSAPRNAFLALVRINVKKMAVKLYASLQNPEKKARLFQKWCKLGGNAKKLENAILKAYAKYKRKRGMGEIGYMDLQETGIGSISSLLATALPIIQALKEFLKGATGGEDAEPETEGTPVQQTEETQTDEQINGTTNFLGINPFVLGGGVLLAYLLLRKKK